MPLSDHTASSGWRSGGGPWGQRPGGGGGGGGGGPTPDLEELLRKSQDKLRQAIPGGRLSGPMIGVIAVLLAGVIGFFAFTVRVNPDELGVVLRFGKYVRLMSPGLNFRLPYPIETVYLPKVTRVNRIEIGMRGSGDARNMGASVRDVPEESLMLTGDENIVDVDFQVLWRINDAPEFLFNIQNPTTTVKEVAESAMREVVGQNNIQDLLTEKRNEAEVAVQKLMQTILDNYKAGIEITQVRLQKVDPPAQVIDAFRDVQAARADQERIRNEADAYSNRVIPEARGEAQRILQGAQAYKEQTVAEATGQAARFISIYNEYTKAPIVTRRRMFLETMERVFGDMDKIIIDEQGGGQGVVPYLPLDELIKKRTSGSQQ